MSKQVQCSKCGSGDVHYEQTYGFYECQSCGDIWAYPEDDPDYEEEDLEEMRVFDCGFVPGHGCTMVGSEECDFECPYRDALEKHRSYPNVHLLDS